MPFLKSVGQKEPMLLSPHISVEQKADDKEQSITHFISTPDLDRGGDIVDPHGVDDTDFNKSGTVLFNHNYNFPVAKNLWLKKQDDGVLAKTKFGSTPMAKDIFTLHKEGILNSWSIGFMIDHEKQHAAEWKDGKFYINFLKLFEYSSVSVAMNPNAIDTVKSMVKSIQIKEEFERLDEEEKVKAAILGYSKELAELREYIKGLAELNAALGNFKTIDAAFTDIKAEIKTLSEKIATNAVKDAGETVGTKKLVTIDLKSLAGDIVTGAVSRITGKE